MLLLPGAGLLDLHVRVALTLALLLIFARIAVETMISAVSPAALALLLDARLEVPARSHLPAEGTRRWRPSLRAVIAGGVVLATQP